MAILFINGLDDGNAESRCLARTGLSLSDDIIPFKCKGNGPFLGDGSSKPMSFRAERIFLSRFRSSKVVIVGSVIGSPNILVWHDSFLSFIHGKGHGVHCCTEFDGRARSPIAKFLYNRAMLCCTGFINQSYRFVR